MPSRDDLLALRDVELSTAGAPRRRTAGVVA